jgi:hypothetical protein
VLALCGARLHAFAGGPSLEQLFAAYSADSLGGLEARYIDLPTQAGAAQLQLLYPPKQPDLGALLDSAAAAGGAPGGSSSSGGGAGSSGGGGFETPRPEVFAVLSPSGIYYGRLDLDPGIADAADHLVKHHLLPAAVLHMPPQQQQQQSQQQRQAEAPAERPLSVVSVPPPPLASLCVNMHRACMAWHHLGSCQIASQPHTLPLKCCLSPLLPAPCALPHCFLPCSLPAPCPAPCPAAFKQPHTQPPTHPPACRP